MNQFFRFKAGDFIDILKQVYRGLTLKKIETENMHIVKVTETRRKEIITQNYNDHQPNHHQISSCFIFV